LVVAGAKDTDAAFAFSFWRLTHTLAFTEVADPFHLEGVDDSFDSDSFDSSSFIPLSF
jgi:hypothetical protein